MGGGRVTQVTSKAQWDQIMGENAGKAVRDKGWRGLDLPHSVRRIECLCLACLPRARRYDRVWCEFLHGPVAPPDDSCLCGLCTL